MASVESVAGMIAYELSRKLDLPGLRFDFRGPWAQDVHAWAASFVKLMATDGNGYRPRGGCAYPFGPCRAAWPSGRNRRIGSSVGGTKPNLS